MGTGIIVQYTAVYVTPVVTCDARGTRCYAVCRLTSTASSHNNATTLYCLSGNVVRRCAASVKHDAVCTLPGGRKKAQVAAHEPSPRQPDVPLERCIPPNPSRAPKCQLSTPYFGVDAAAVRCDLTAFWKMTVVVHCSIVMVILLFCCSEKGGRIVRVPRTEIGIIDTSRVCASLAASFRECSCEMYKSYGCLGCQ